MSVPSLQDLHCLQRFYHNVDHWGIKALPSHQFQHLVELLLVRYRNVCLRLFVVLLDLHCLQRFYHILFGIVQRFVFTSAIVSELCLLN